MGEILSFLAGFALALMLVIPDNDADSIEKRAKAVYERRAASLDWYEGDKHIQP